jgi:tRNA (uracil-5-)-methyltransferase
MSDSDGGVEITSHHENPSYHDPVDASTYVSALDAKVGELERLFSPLLQQASVPILYAKGIDRGVAVRPEVFSSPPLHFRSRCRFQVMWDDATVTAESIGTSPRETATPGRRLSYRMWNKGEPTVSINEFPMALRVIETLMPAVLREAEAQPELGDGLQAIHFLASRGARGGMLVTMVYDRPIDEGWKIAAEGPRARLKSVMEDIRAEVYAAGDNRGTDAVAGARGDDDDEFEATSLNILGRSRGTQIVVGDACHVFERLTLRDGRTLTYRQSEGAFSNPNSFVAESTLDWLCDCAATTVRDVLGSSTGENSDAGAPSLLEMYSGNGNHTVALAKYFDRVAAVELSGVLCEAARENLARNGVDNAKVLHSPSESVARGMLRRKKRHEEGRAGKAAMAAAAGGSGDDGGSTSGAIDFDVDAYDVVLVDPPRAGLDADTMDLVSRFEVVLYISCDPRKGLLENAVGPEAAKALDGGEFEGELKGWTGLAKTHDLVRFAVFDHFPYTRHIECGACFVRRR